MDPASRKALLAQCPAIFMALGDVLSTTAKEAASAAAAAAAGSAAAGGDADADADAATNNGDKKRQTLHHPASSPMLKTKRLKPLLACLSATIKAAAAEEGTGTGGSPYSLLSGLAAEALSLKTALEAVGEASASLAMQLQCGQVAEELDAIVDATGGVEAGAGAGVPAVGGKEEEEGGGVAGGSGKKKKRKVKGDSSSPKKPKRKAVDDADPATPAAAAGTAAGREEEEGKVKDGSSSKKEKRKKKKKRRESTEG